MKKHIFFLIVIALVFIALPTAAKEQFSYNFEKPEDAQMWSGGEFDGANYFDYGFSLFVSNPFGEVRNEKSTHVLDYSPTINLEAGKVYTLKGMAFDPLSSSEPSIRANAIRAPGANTVIINVSGIGDDWAEFSTTFFAGESGEYNLSIHFLGGTADFGIFADEISLEETPCILSALNVTGPQEIIIPAEGSITSYYKPFLITSDNKTVDILTSSNIYFSVSEAPGISFDRANFGLITSSDAIANTSLSLNCTLKNYEFLSPVSLTINLKNNMLKSDFSDSSAPLWHGSSDLSYATQENHLVMSVPTNDYGEFGYFAEITYDEQLVLLKDILYVVRGRVKTDNPNTLPPIYATNSSENKNSNVTFSIKDISGTEWNDVFIAFTPEASGIYTISLKLYSTFDCTIYIDNLSLAAETPKAEYITLHAPGNIALPNSFVSYPVTALLRDQTGQIIPSEDIKISLLQENEHLEFSSETNMLTIHPDSPVGVYTLYAEYIHDADVKGRLDFTVSYDFIGDGDFEETFPNQWWMVSSPNECNLYMRHDGHSRRALINSKGSYFMLLNNSYVHLTEGTPYVFNSAFSSPVNCYATLFLEKLDSSAVPLSQVFIPAGTSFNSEMLPELFLAEEDMVGRVFLYVECIDSESFSIYADNLSLKRASIIAVNPRVTGIPYINGAVEAEFSLYNNISESTDKSMCAVNWFVSDTQNGVYTDVPTGGRSIYFDTTFLNKYVYFEVTPICPVTGFSGSTVRSLPFLVTYNPSENSSALPIFTPTLKSNIPEDSYFADTRGHWAQKYIDILAYSEAVNGLNEETFSPDTFVTRGEFSKMLSKAFSINTSSNIFSFSDVPKDAWYYQYVNSLYLAGIVSGVSETLFLPEGYVSREEATVMIMRIFDKKADVKPKNEEPYFSDYDEISPWAADSVKKAVSLKIIEGTPWGEFLPKGRLSRAEAAALICRLADSLS